jgi:hypothetical protein
MTDQERIEDLEHQVHEMGEHLAQVSQALAATVHLAQDCDADQEQRIVALETARSSALEPSMN